MVLESFAHEHSSFATLTYNEVPAGNSLSIEHCRDWLKRLRWSYSPKKIRFFLAGEYGDKSQRPHYHVALFGIDRITAGGMDGISGLVQSSWGHGYTYVGDLNVKSAAYIAGYVTKKINKYEMVKVKKIVDGVNREYYLDGRLAQFNRMSLRPGIGFNAVENISETLASDAGLGSIKENRDVPGSLRILGSILPLGRYIRGKLRQRFEVIPFSLDEIKGKKYLEELQELRIKDEAIAEAEKKSFGQFILDRRTQNCKNLAARALIHSGEKI